jgi:sulfonate transport system ATP-binding protein
MVFQEHRLMPWMTVEANVAFPFGRRERRTPAARARVREVLTLVGLEDFAGAWPYQLSGGMAQRAAVARALVTLPRVLLLDEPFGALDSRLRGQMQAELVRIVEENELTTVLVTHDVDEALALADRILVMSGPPGRISGELHVGLARPRRDTDEEVVALRVTLLDHLHGRHRPPGPPGPSAPPVPSVPPVPGRNDDGALLVHTDPH